MELYMATYFIRILSLVIAKHLMIYLPSKLCNFFLIGIENDDLPNSNVDGEFLDFAKVLEFTLRSMWQIIDQVSIRIRENEQNERQTYLQIE